MDRQALKQTPFDQAKVSYAKEDEEKHLERLQNSFEAHQQLPDDWKLKAINYEIRDGLQGR